MERFIPLLRFLALLVLALRASRPALGYQPTNCADPAVMQAELSRFASRSFLTDATGIRGSDGLHNHVTDFLRSGIGHNIDLRLAAGIVRGSASPSRANIGG